MIAQVTGRRGSGKTLFACRQALLDAEVGREVFTTFHVDHPSVRHILRIEEIRQPIIPTTVILDPSECFGLPDMLKLHHWHLSGCDLDIYLVTSFSMLQLMPVDVTFHVSRDPRISLTTVKVAFPGRYPHHAFHYVDWPFMGRYDTTEIIPPVWSKP